MYFAVENNKGLFKGSGSDDVLREKFARQLKWCTDVMDVFAPCNEAEIKKCSTFSALSRMEAYCIFACCLICAEWMLHAAFKGQTGLHSVIAT